MTITLRYKKPNWIEWVYLPCADEAEAAKWRAALEARGYIVES